MFDLCKTSCLVVSASLNWVVTTFWLMLIAGISASIAATCVAVACVTAVFKL